MEVGTQDFSKTASKAATSRVISSQNPMGTQALLGGLMDMTQDLNPKPYNLITRNPEPSKGKGQELMGLTRFMRFIEGGMLGTIRPKQKDAPGPINPQP